MHKHLSSFLKLLTLSSLLVVSIAYAWTAPTALPPAGNTPPPLNTSITGQIKSGGLVIDSLGIVNTALSALNVSGGGLFGGSVGIGTTTPTSMHKLTVAAPVDARMDVRSDTAGYATVRLVSNNPNYGSVDSMDAGYTVAKNLVLNPNGGNVGIGIAAPVTKLNIAGNGKNIAGSGVVIGTVGDAISTAVPLNSEVGRFELGFPGWRDCESSQIGAKIASIRMNRYVNNLAYIQSSDLAFFTGTGSNPPAGSTGCDALSQTYHDTSNERMRIDAYGKVGIGTTAPVGSLQVAGTAFNPFGLPNGNIAVGNIVHPQWAATGVALGNQGAGTNTGVIGYNADTFWISELNSGATAIPLVSISPTGTLTANTDVCTAGGKCLSGAATLAGGVANTIPKWTGASALGNSSITDNGTNVGIGTTAPFSKTTIAKPGVSALTTSDATNNAHLTLAGSDSLVRLQFGTMNVAPYSGLIQASYDNGGAANGLEALSLNPNGGNVGIGTTAPGAKLEVYNAAPGYNTKFNTAVGNYQYHAFQVGGVDKGYIQWNINDLATTAGTSMIFNNIQGSMHLRDSTNSGLTISGGNVGIGTTAPGAKLEIGGAFAGGDLQAILARGADLNFQLIAQNGVAGNTVGSEVGRFGLRYGASGWNSGLRFLRGGGAIDGAIAIDTNNAEALRINSAGQVGIGTATPSAKLHVMSTALGTAGLVISGQSGNTWFPYINGWNYIRGGTFFGGDTGVITPTGNVGIGTTGPTQKLEVVGGAIKATGGFILETRATDPVAPVAGQMWLIVP